MALEKSAGPSGFAISNHFRKAIFNRLPGFEHGLSRRRAAAQSNSRPSDAIDWPIFSASPSPFYATNRRRRFCRAFPRSRIALKGD